MAEAIRALHGTPHILIVDDNSPDGTGKLADELSTKYPGEVMVLHRERKEGLGRAYVAAFQHVLKNFSYDFIIQMDCDFSHDPVYVPQLDGEQVCRVHHRHAVHGPDRRIPLLTP